MLLSEYFVLYTILLIVLFVIVSSVIIYRTTEPYPRIWRAEDEKYFYNPKKQSIEVFPSLYDKWSIHISVVIPAYNEAKRLPIMLDECLNYLEERAKSDLTYEVIIVSDGSTDNTVDVALGYASKYDNVRVLALTKNRGKGGAVRLGVLSARGSAILFADADGATEFKDLEKLDSSLKAILGCTLLLHYLERLLEIARKNKEIYVLSDDYMTKPNEVSESHAIVCGSRAHLEEEETAKRSLFRLILMHGFHFLVWLLCVRGIRDTQCGFKLLTRRSARIVFQALHVERWAFDVEMLYIAQTLNIPITEIPVYWTEIEGSKIVPFWSSLQMGRDLFLIWFRYTIGAWKIQKLKTQ